MVPLYFPAQCAKHRGGGMWSYFGFEWAKLLQPCWTRMEPPGLVRRAVTWNLLQMTLVIAGWSALGSYSRCWGGEPAGAGRDWQFREVQSYLIGQRELHCCCVPSATVSKIHDTMRAYGSVLMTLERFNLGKAGGVGGCKCYLYHLQPGPSQWV